MNQENHAPVPETDAGYMQSVTPDLPGVHEVERLGRLCAAKGCGVLLRSQPGAGMTTALHLFRLKFEGEFGQHKAGMLHHAFASISAPIYALRRVFGVDEPMRAKLARIHCQDEAVEVCRQHARDRGIRLLVLDRCDHVETACLDVVCHLSAVCADHGHPLGLLLAGRNRSSSLLRWDSCDPSRVVTSYTLPLLDLATTVSVLADVMLPDRLGKLRTGAEDNDPTALEEWNAIHQATRGILGELRKLADLVEFLQPEGEVSASTLKAARARVFWSR